MPEEAGRNAFVARLTVSVTAGALIGSACARLPNHAPLRVQTDGQPLPASKRRLLTGYGVICNRRTRRVEQLFQNRDKFIVPDSLPQGHRPEFGGSGVVRRAGGAGSPLGAPRPPPRQSPRDPAPEGPVPGLPALQ